MRASTNITRKERNALTLKDFRGADFTSSPYDAASNRAVEMKNLYCVNGQLHKRPGWEQLAKLDGKINGVFYYTGKGLSCYVVHAGAKLYKTADKAFTAELTLISDGLNDSRSQAFLKGTRLYIVNSGSMYVLGWRSVEEYDYASDTTIFYEVFGLLDSEQTEAYVPTTTIGIGGYLSDEEWDGDNREAKDAVNILTRARTNTLVGRKLDSGELTYKLDGYVNTSAAIKVTIELSEDLYVTMGMASDNLVNDSVQLGAKGETLSFSIGNGNTSLDVEFTYEDVSASATVGYVSANRLVLQLPGDYSPAVPGISNITVTFEAYGTDRSSLIKKCSFGIQFGVSASDRLFLSGHPSYPDRVFFSHNNDFTYFPDTNYITQGGTVTGFAALSDATLAVFKDNDAGNGHSFFLVSGDYVTKTLKTGEEYVDEVFRVVGGAQSEACISHYANDFLAGDSLMLSENGVFGVELTDNVSTNERYLRERSRLINKRLCAHDLSRAVGITYKNRYYLSVNDGSGACYVADARYKVSVDDDIDGSYNYEWWYWDNVHASTWMIFDDKLYFGTDDGRICVFDDKYSDRTYTSYTASGDFSVRTDENDVLFNYDLTEEIAECNRVRFESGLYSLLLGNATVENGRIRAKEPVTDADGNLISGGIFDIHEGMEICVDSVGSSGLSVDTVYYVSDVDYASCTFALKGVTPASGGFKLYKALTDKDLYITNLKYDADGAQDDTFQLRETPDGPVLEISRYNDSNYGSPTLRLIRAEPVVAEWCSPPLDFGTAESSKTLLKLTAVAESVAGGKITFGYETRNARKQLDMRGINKFSLDELDFKDFTLDTGFANSYSVKVFRRFNFIQLKYRSDNDRDCALNSLTAIYKINKSNIGVK